MGHPTYWTLNSHFLKSNSLFGCRCHLHFKITFEIFHQLFVERVEVVFIRRRYFRNKLS